MRVFAAALAAMAFGVSAAAADLPVKAPIRVPVVYDWTGFYIGANVGYSWGRSRSDWDFVSPGTGAIFSTGTSTQQLDGFVGGGQIGYNWQITNWVVGLEADFQGTGERGTTSGICITATTTVCPRQIFDLSQKIEWFGTVRGRVGIAVAPTWLLYATGGLAYGSVKTDVNGIVAGTPAAASLSETKVGGTIGAGIETMFSGNWSAKLEYLYVDLGTFSDTTPLFNVRFEHNSRVTDHVLRFGINYRFAPGPIVARY